MKILIIEPFLTGSHKTWAEDFQKHSNHTIEIMGLKGSFWKWRMHGGAIELAKQFLELDYTADLIIASDMLDLTTFVSLARHKLRNTKISMYFHENQLSYPWSPNDKDVKLKRDLHYGFINYTSALCSDHIYFNSNYHMQSFYNALNLFLKAVPDYKNLQAIEELKSKSSVLSLGLDLNKFDSSINQNKLCTIESNLDTTNHIYSENKAFTFNFNKSMPLIIWNHRWEYDKNPESFFNALFKLKEKNLKFKVAILGESYKNKPKIFEKAKLILKDEIVKFGMADTFKEYAEWLRYGDILPITSNQDFFGISIMEGVYCGLYPILPERLTYPDLYDIKNNPQLFYSTELEFVDKLEFAIKNVDKIRKINYNTLTHKYDWSNMTKIYDEEVINLLK
ncbi:tRNA-queuosine alpha-mannosyltransferase domain-containing protein [Clostridium sp. DL1XJH146]